MSDFQLLPHDAVSGKVWIDLIKPPGSWRSSSGRRPSAVNNRVKVNCTPDFRCSWLAQRCGVVEIGVNLPSWNVIEQSFIEGRGQFAPEPVDT